MVYLPMIPQFACEELLLSYSVVVVVVVVASRVIVVVVAAVAVTIAVENVSVASDNSISHACILSLLY